MSDFFKPEDFNQYAFNPTTSQMAANVANDKLRDCIILTKEDIEKMPVVYGAKPDEGWIMSEVNSESVLDDYRARLAFIEIIKKEEPKECDHSVEAKSFVKCFLGDDDASMLCKKCGKKLKAKWEVCE